MGLSKLGFERITYDEFVERLSQRSREQLGEDIDCSETSVYGKFLRIIAYDLAAEYETLENVYYARFPNTASGVSLDRLCVFAGIARNPATYARHNIKVTGTADTTVLMGGLIVGNEDNITFYNENDFTIGSDGTADIIVAAVDYGSGGNVDSIDTIVNPVTGIASIEYVGLEEAGEDIESDYDLRKRFSIAVAGAGSCNEDAIRGYVARIQGIESVVIATNDTNSTDSDGRPAHSFEVYIYGGEGQEQEIADAIFLKKPIGIKAVTTETGSNAITKTVTDEGGFSHSISFSRVTEVTIDINVSIKTNSSYTANGAASIKNNLVKYVSELGVGGSVVTSAMYSHVFEVTGVTEVVSITQAKSGNTPSAATINCAMNEVPITSATNITVTVVSA